MSATKLQIISPSGQQRFYGLNPNKGIANIGRDQRNDIVIDSPNVAPFHAILNYRQEPYRIVRLTSNGQLVLRGQSLPANVPIALQNRDTVQIGEYAIMLVEQPLSAPVTGYATTQATALDPARRSSFWPETLPVQPAAIPPPTTRPEVISVPQSRATIIPPPTQPTDLATYMTEHLDDVIITALDNREWTIDVEQTAECELTIVNGGNIVAGFYVQVIGVDGSWLTITPLQVNLFEGNRATVTITITPPRHPSSYAGVHKLAVVVTSPDYPGRQSKQITTLIINPYYQFSTGELSPKRQSISWFRRSGKVLVPIVNKGNSPTMVRIEGEDDERGCSFEFKVPGEEVGLARQADYPLPVEQTADVPITITPHSRWLVGFQKRTYSFTITTTLLEGEQAPRSLLGSLKSAPLIGPGLLVMMGILLTALILYIFWPTVDILTADRQVVQANEEIRLFWNASPFVSLNLNNESVQGPQGTETFTLHETTQFILRADNWLRRILPGAWTQESAVKQVQVFVTPVPPQINTFQTEKADIVAGQPVRLFVDVEHADDVVLQSDDGNQQLDSADYNQGTLNFSPNQDTVYTLVASNRYGQREDSVRITVSQPTATPTTTPTPIPTPNIVLFNVNPRVITAGQEVKIEWLVQNADSVVIEPINVQALPSGNISHSPQENTPYVLTARNGSAQAISPVQEVIVGPPPTATATPAPPTIVFFTPDPTDFVRGDESQVTLKWLVSGQVTNIQISGPTLATPIENLNPEDWINLAINNTTSFVLTAFNGEQKISQTVQVGVDEPTPTSTPSPTTTPLPTSTATPIPASIQTFQISSPGAPQVVDRGGTNPRRYEVQANTSVIFSWVANNATKVIFTPSGGQSQDGASIGQSSSQLISGSGTQNYTLVAENSVGQLTPVYVIEVTIVNQSPPNPPFNLLGTENNNVSNTLTWNWTFDPNKSDIIGFRVYRANVPGGSFAVIANENVLGKTTLTYVDSLNPTCGKSYYVVAVYNNIQGLPQESTVSTNSWNSAACP